MNKIFYGGVIITMEDELYSEAVLVRDGVIAALGSFDELNRAAPNAVLTDLRGATMLPAFIDAHGHF